MYSVFLYRDHHNVEGIADQRVDHFPEPKLATAFCDLAVADHGYEIAQLVYFPPSRHGGFVLYEACNLDLVAS